MSSLVITSAVRTAIGKFGGSLSSIPATELGALVMQEAIRRAQISADDLNEVNFGNVLQAGLGPKPGTASVIESRHSRFYTCHHGEYGVWFWAAKHYLFGTKYCCG